MEHTKQEIEKYIKSLKPVLNPTNHKLLSQYAERHQVTTTEPNYYTTLTVVQRLKTIILLLDNKPLNQLTEQDIINLNAKMKEKGFRSTKDYRRVLKQFMKLVIRPTFEKTREGKEKRADYDDLINSDYLRKRRTKKEKLHPLVDPKEFWENEHIEKYLEASVKHSPGQACWAALWLSTGCRPIELFALTKKDIQFETQPQETILVNVPVAKTKARTIPFYNGEASAIKNYIEPYLTTLNENDKLFPRSYHAQKKTHLIICKRIQLPEGKRTNFYIARKMALTRFYRQYQVADASEMSGHEQGTSSMKHYIGIQKQDYLNGKVKAIETKICPNPSCSALNEPHHTHCFKCNAPLDREQYRKIYESQLNSLLDTRVALIKSELKAELLEKKK